MKGEILAEVMLVEEPDIELMSVQEDSMYHYEYKKNVNEEIDPMVESNIRSELSAALVVVSRPEFPRGGALIAEPMTPSAIRRMRTELETEKMKNKKLIEETLEQSIEVVKLQEAMREDGGGAGGGLGGGCEVCGNHGGEGEERGGGND